MFRALRRLRARIRYRRFEHDLAEELEFHHAMKAREWQERGAAPSEVRIMTRRDMGNVLREREASRAVWIAQWMDSLWQDLSYAARSLRRQPGFTLTAVAALILGIGLNTTAFTIFNGIALNPWPVSDPARVVRVFKPRDVFRRGGASATGFSLPEYRYLRDHTRTFTGLIAAREGGGRLGHEAIGQHTPFSYVSANYFDVLGIHMALGRGFLPDEDHAGMPAAVAVIGYTLWERQFNADRAILGRTIRIDDVPFVVVGVANAGFGGTAPSVQELWLPFSAVRLLDREGTRAADLLEKASHCCSNVAGRLYHYQNDVMDFIRESKENAERFVENPLSVMVEVCRIPEDLRKEILELQKEWPRTAEEA